MDAIGIGKSLEYLALGLIWARMINNIHDEYLGVDPTRKHDRCIAWSPCRDWRWPFVEICHMVKSPSGLDRLDLRDSESTASTNTRSIVI